MKRYGIRLLALLIAFSLIDFKREYFDNFNLDEGIDIV